MELPMGVTATAELQVSKADLASSLVNDDRDEFPPVLATGRMIALMETAAARAMQGVLRDGELSVGVGIDITHSAPTPLGDGVVATARYMGMEEDKFYLFEIIAHDSGGEIGRGKHKRAVVTTERLMSKIEKRKKR